MGRRKKPKHEHEKQQEKQDAQSADKQLVFVYGTLMQGHKLNGHMLSIGAKRVGVGRILNKAWVMRHLGSFPALQPVEQGAGDYIVGEVWLTDKAGLCSLDTVEGAPDFYKRYREHVWIDDGNGNSRSFMCTLYAIDGRKKGNEWLWQCEIIRSGSWDSNQVAQPEGDDTVPWENGFRCNNCGVPDSDLTDAGLCTECDDLYGDNAMHQTYPQPETTPVVEGSDAAIDFVVEKGVYITNDWGDMHGPYDSINAAVNALATFDKGDLECVNVMTIGFRVIRSNLDKDQLADIDSRTYA